MDLHLLCMLAFETNKAICSVQSRMNGERISLFLIGCSGVSDTDGRGLAFESFEKLLEAVSCGGMKLACWRENVPAATYNARAHSVC